jgi:quercetin dioxygenase-like cupin family protein
MGRREEAESWDFSFAESQLAENCELLMNHFVFKDMTPRVPAPGVEMRVIHGEKMTMVFFKLEPGAGVPLHAHPHEQVGTVLKGSIEFVIADEKRIVREGEAYQVPSNVLHGGKCGESPSEIIEVFSPVREDLR